MSGNFHPIVIKLEQNGVPKLLEGSLLLPLHPGEYKEPILPNPDAPLPSWLSDWLFSTGLDGMAESLTTSSSLWRLSHFLLPQLPSTDERLRLFSRYLIFSSLAAHHEEMVNMRSGNSKMADLMADLVSDILTFKYESTRDLPEIPTSTIPLFTALFSLRNDSAELIPDFKSSATPLVTAMRVTILANSRLGLKVMSEVPGTFKYLKRYAGWEVMLELGALLLGFNLPPTIRQELMLQRVLGLAATIVVTIADLKEWGQEGENETNWVTFTQKAGGLELEPTWGKVLEELEREVKEFKILVLTLRGLHKKNLRLSKYLKTVETFIHGICLGF